MRAEVAKSITMPGAVRVPARAPRWVVPAVKFGLAISDVALATASFVLAFKMRHGQTVFYRDAQGALTWAAAFAPYAVLLPLVIPIRLLLLRYYDLYRVRGEFSFVDDLARVLKATAIGSLLIVAAAFMYRGGIAYRTFSYSRAIFVLDFALVFASVATVRMALRTAQIVVRRRGVNLIPTLIVGRGPEASLCIREMRARPELGYRVIGIVDNERGGVYASSEFEDVPVIGSLANLPEADRKSSCRERV